MHTSNWNVSYPKSDGSKPGPYVVEVLVEKWAFLVYYDYTSERIQIDLTSKKSYGIFFFLNYAKHLIFQQTRSMGI